MPVLEIIYVWGLYDLERGFELNKFVRLPHDCFSRPLRKAARFVYYKSVNTTVQNSVLHSYNVEDPDTVSQLMFCLIIFVMLCVGTLGFECTVFSVFKWEQQGKLWLRN